MEIQLEPISQGLEQFGPWHFGDVRLQQDRRAELQAALLQTAAFPCLSDRLLEISKAGRADCHASVRPEVTLSVSKACGSALQGPSRPASPGRSVLDPTANKTAARTLFPTSLHPSLTFTRIAPSDKALVTFPLPARPLPQRPCLKRRRPDTDVDGYDTAALGCKKRRILRHLITSRLSQPFSLPATHILNRESAATGDKRFLKLAAIMSARRLNSAVMTQQPPPPQQPSPSTWLRRAAVLNRLRSRVCAEQAERGVVPAPDLAAKAVILQQHPNSTVSKPNPNQPPPNPIPRGPYGPAQTPGPPPPSPSAWMPPPGYYPAASQTSPSAPATHLASPHNTSTTAPPPQTPPTTCLRIPSPQLRPLRSPELRVTRPLVPLLLEDMEDLDDDSSMAFPTSELESRYDDDSEDDENGGGVYADFSVIFGGGAGCEDEDEDGFGGGGVEGVEDYMDEVDGIPWGVGSI